MKSRESFSKERRVTLMGLGLLGRGLGDAIFLAEHGADLIVTDLKDAKALAPSLAKLQKYKNIRYTLGKHTLEDFRNRDFILKAAGVALDSPYIAEAVKNKIPIEMDASLFAKLMPKGVTLVGVTGTRGKSTVTALIHDILSSSAPLQRGSASGFRGKGVRQRGAVRDKGLRIKDSPHIFRGGNLVPKATLPLLAKVKTGDIVVLELDSWQLQGFHDAKLSPQIAVFTTFLDDHLIYYKGNTDRYFEDKVAVFRYQKAGDTLIAGERVAGLIGKSGVPVNGNFIIAKKEDVPSDWNIPIPGEHNLENIACALAVARHFKISEAVIKKAVEHFQPVPGRLEYLRIVRGVKIYNDNNATTPDATIAALRALSSSAPLQRGSAESARRRGADIILIMGGTDKVLGRHDALVEEIFRCCKAVILLKETGTDIIKNKIYDSRLRRSGFGGQVRFKNKRLQVKEADGLKECITEAMKLAIKGDIVLFSPAFASFGKWFKNEYDRGEQFVELVKKL